MSHIYGVLARQDPFAASGGQGVNLALLAHYAADESMLRLGSNVGDCRLLEWRTENPAEAGAEVESREWLSKRLRTTVAETTTRSTLPSPAPLYLPVSTLPPLSGVRHSLVHQNPCYYDVLVESPDKFRLFIVACGCLERWTSDAQQQTPEGRRERWERDGLSVVGFSEPFRVVRPEKPIVLLTDQGKLVEHVPNENDPKESKSEVKEERVIALMDRGHDSIVFSTNRFTVIPHGAQFSWTWKPYRREESYTFKKRSMSDEQFDPVNAIAERVEFIKHLLEEVE
jgi:hypothetical protein